MISNMNISNYKNIIWDWNGTLLNDVWLCADIMNNLLKKRSLPEITLERYRDIFTFPVEEYYLKAGHTFEEESFKVIGKEFMDEYELRKGECNLYPFSIKVLNKISDLGIHQYLLSAYKHESLNNLVAEYGLSDYFRIIRGLDHIYADGKLELGKKLIADISNNGYITKTLLIGDTVHDFEVADKLGIDCLLISSGHQSENKLQSKNIKMVNSMEELYFQMINN